MHGKKTKQLMIDITSKSTTLRYAKARAVLSVSKPATIEAIQQRTIPKGDVLEIARAAGLLGIKKTAELIPDCHPLPIEFAAVTYDIKAQEIHIVVEIKTIYKTGVEVEAMHGASIVALTMYDMLKPVDKGIVIRTIELVEKTGGKSNYKEQFREPIKAAVIVCSDTVAAGQKEDKAGQKIVEQLKQHGCEIADYCIVPDEVSDIQRIVQQHIDAGTQLILTCGGTGLSIRDVTPEAVTPLIKRQVPGIAEVARSFGQARMPYAMLSRGVAGVTKSSLIVTLPGSTNGAKETVDALFPHALHVFNILKGAPHKTST
jgi:cyclic pyranopterin phosphate synthase